MKYKMLIILILSFIVLLGFTIVIPNVFRTYNCKNCNNRICNETAGMLLFDKNRFCEESNLINPTYNEQKIVYKFTQKNNCDGFNEPNKRLEGYYIEPLYNVNSNSNSNQLKFSPLWISTAPNGRILEEIGEPIILGPSFFHSSTLNIPTIPMNSPLIGATPITNGNFNHSIFQFNPEAIRDTFGKAYISWHSLKLILENCDYLGIMGAYVSSGNIGVVEWSNPSKPGLLKKICNQNYFTYRFIGFNKFTSPQNVTIQLFLKSNLKPDSNSINTTYNSMPTIPTETWAVPCPPMWKPSN